MILRAPVVHSTAYECTPLTRASPGGICEAPGSTDSQRGVERTITGARYEQLFPSSFPSTSDTTVVSRYSCTKVCFLHLTRVVIKSYLIFTTYYLLVVLSATEIVKSHRCCIQVEFVMKGVAGGACSLDARVALVLVSFATL